MTNTLPSGAGAGPSSAYTPISTSGSGTVPRRSSYASVVSGSAPMSSHAYQQPARSGALSHLMNQASPSTYQPQQHSRHHSRHPSRGLEGDGYSGGGGNSAPGSWSRGSQLPSYSSQFGSAGSFGYVTLNGSPQFFTPTYLRDSRYVERLSELYKAKVAAHREGHNSNGGSLSTSSSSANLHKLTPSHRGMTYDIIEKESNTEDDSLTSLPSRWNESDRAAGISIQADGMEAGLAGPVGKGHSSDNEAAAVRADHFMPPQCGIYYFEVSIVTKSKEGSMIAVGFSGPKVTLNRFPGWEAESWAYHGDDGNVFCCNALGKPYGKKFSSNDVVGCGMNFRTGCAFFTKNGLHLGIAFNQLKGRGPFYPSVGMKKPGEHVRVNFGQSPFVFDIDGMMAKEKILLEQEINGTIGDNLSAGLNETALIQALVAQYLAHDGYVETARAFAAEITSESEALRIPGYAESKPFQAEEDLDAVNRQRIRGAILEGDIDKALKHTHAYYPNVLRHNPHIYFRMRCRKFIEMMKQCSDLLSATQRSVKKRKDSVNGRANSLYDDVFEHDMELDDQIQEAEDWEKLESEEADATVQYQNLLDETLLYGRVLKSEFQNDGREEVKKALEETFSLITHEDPKQSIVAHLLEPSGRVPVAEELNSAILVSLGRSSCASLERLQQQTEVLVDCLGEDGGSGAFINVRKDYLK